jgi:hypothetical protein
MLPSKGVCHAILIMLRAAHLRRPADIADWINSSKKQLPFIASAADFEKIAELMVRVGLVSITNGIQLLKHASALGYLADDFTLKQIARLVLQESPPPWIESALTIRGLAIEYIPTRDFKLLQWLGNELEKILQKAVEKSSRQKSTELKEKLGRAGELVVMLSKEFANENPVRVSNISDSFGYDVEAYNATGVNRIEVKTTVPRSKESFYVSRNEFEKSILFGPQWYIVQIVLSASILFKDKLQYADVLEANFLSAKQLRDIVPVDSRNFRWMESAFITPEAGWWCKYELPLPKNLEIDLSGIIEK